MTEMREVELVPIELATYFNFKGLEWLSLEKVHVMRDSRNEKKALDEAMRAVHDAMQQFARERELTYLLPWPANVTVNPSNGRYYVRVTREFWYVDDLKASQGGAHGKPAQAT